MAGEKHTSTRPESSEAPRQPSFHSLPAARPSRQSTSIEDVMLQTGSVPERRTISNDTRNAIRSVLVAVLIAGGVYGYLDYKKERDQAEAVQVRAAKDAEQKATEKAIQDEIHYKAKILIRDAEKNELDEKVKNALEEAQRANKLKIISPTKHGKAKHKHQKNRP
ncbi:MAG: hypothetical protein NTX63_01225 [Candidatus Peregrinibacteria bacterium]|nr:hypothetical protein [Candidatus Peregrinibacteria bacterium]